ncbi:MAG: DUF2110 family protein [Candidatus Bathyarchaeia archaeon]|nr:DUF2110 family protein [Candidatus Bathyarchaeota archaeon]
MTVVLLASKIYNEKQMTQVEEYLKTLLKGLRVKIDSVEVTANSRIRASFSGEDEKAALSLIEREIGLGPADIKDLKKFSTVRGYITNLSKSRDEIHVDIGVVFPKTLNATISLQRLQAQLADGRKITLQKIAELYGLSENMPITVKITGLSENHIEAELAEAQLATYRQWIKSLLDRLIVLGASQLEIQKALRNTKCQNDIIAMEPLGLFEHTAICKFGTDAVGLIPKIGKYLQGAKLEAFKPKTLLEFFKNINVIK